MACNIEPQLLEQYINFYSVHGALQRLIFIAKNTKENQGELTRTALTLALDLAKRTSNVVTYNELHATFQSKLGEAAPVPKDDVWASAADKQASQLLESYDQELNSAKMTRGKEDVRQAYVKLANLHADRGDYAQALKAAIKARENASDPGVILPMCWLVIKYAALNKSFIDINSHAGKAQHTPFKKEEDNSRIHAAQGIYNMHNGKYSEACTHFFQVKDSDLGDTLNDMAMPQDVVTYGVLCGLATLDRKQLRDKITELGNNWVQGKDSIPSMWNVVDKYLNCSYADCLEALEKMRPALELDLYLSKHVKTLLDNIRQRAIVQYFAPFRSVRLATMAEVFHTSENDLQGELVKLIQDKKLNAKIDVHRKLVVAKYVFMFKSEKMFLM